MNDKMPFKPYLNEQQDTLDPRYTLEEQFPDFTSELPFTFETNEKKETLEQSYISFHQGINSSISKFALNSKTLETRDEISSQLNKTANQIIKKTAESLGYNPSHPAEIIKADLFTIDATLGILIQHINQSASEGKTLSETQDELLLAFNSNLSTAEYQGFLSEFETEIQTMPVEDLKKSPRDLLILSTLPDQKLLSLVDSLISKADPDSKEKLIYIADQLPTSNKNLVGKQLLDYINQNPENQFAKETFQELCFQNTNEIENHAIAIQENMSKINKKFDFGRGWEGITQNRLLLSVAYIWSTITFLSNSIAAGSLILGGEADKHKTIIAKNLAIAGASAGIMGATGMSLLTGKPPLEIAENYFNKALNFLTLDKQDIDSQNVVETKITIPRLLDRSGPYISAIFTDNDIIQSIVSTESLIDEEEKLTDETAISKLENIYKEIKSTNPKKAEFFKQNYILPSQANPQKALLFVYFLQKSYLKEGVDITTRNSFMATLDQNPDQYPEISDFDVLTN